MRPFLFSGELRAKADIFAEYMYFYGLKAGFSAECMKK